MKIINISLIRQVKNNPFHGRNSLFEGIHGKIINLKDDWAFLSKTIPFGITKIFLFATFLSLGIVMCFLLKSGLDVRRQKAWEIQRTQEAYDTFVDETKNQLASYAHGRDPEATFKTLLGYELFISKNKEREGAHISHDTLILRKALPKTQGLLILRIPLCLVAEEIGVARLSQVAGNQTLKTGAQDLYYESKIQGFWDYFLEKNMTYTVVSICLVFGGVISCITALFLRLIFSQDRQERRTTQRALAKAENDLKRVNALNKELLHRASLKAKSEEALLTLRQAYEKRRAVSLSALSKSAVKGGASSYQVEATLGDFQSVILDMMGHFQKQDSSHVSLSKTLEKIHHVMAPQLLREKIQWVVPKDMPDMTIKTDAFLFELCLLVLCTDVVGFVYEGARLLWAHCDGRLSLTVEGDCVDRRSVFLKDAIDVGFMYVNRTQLPKLIRELGMVLCQTNERFELALSPSFSSERPSHGNIIPLFA